MLYEQEQVAQLQNKVIPQQLPKDFVSFWERAVAQVRSVPIQLSREIADTPYAKTVTTWSIRYNTHDATQIDAYFSYPAGATGKLPCVIYYHGGSGHRELCLDIVATGVACFAMDVRGQGGTSIDRAIYNSGDVNGGLMTKGILDENEFYMRNIFMDAVRAVDVVSQLPEVDPERIVTYGGSQGGGLSAVASALSGKSKKAYISEPSYCCLRQRTLLGSRIFGSTNQYLRAHPEHTDRVFQVLRYFDVNHMVSLLNTPSLFSLGLADDVCLPHFVYSAFHHTPAEKEICLYPFTPHCHPPLFKDRIYREFSQL